MKAQENLIPHPVGQSVPAGSAPPVWWLVFKRELGELWLGGRVLNLLILFCLLMSGTAYVLATNVELSLASIDEMILATLQVAMTFGLFIGLIVAAESISGERERGTLEPLLLTPAGRAHMVAGKFLAALSPWPAALALAIPYMVVLSRGDPVLGPAVAWAALLGTLVAVTFTAFGILVSCLSNSNKISLFVSLLAYCLALLPSQLPGEVRASTFGTVIQIVDPLQAASQFLQRTLQDGRPWNESWHFLIGAVVITALILGLLFGYAAPRMRLEAEIRRPFANSLLVKLGLRPAPMEN